MIQDLRRPHPPLNQGEWNDFFVVSLPWFEGRAGVGRVSPA